MRGNVFGEETDVVYDLLGDYILSVYVSVRLYECSGLD
jgi:hypothetical protein